MSTLYIVGTPIGNLDDMSIRAVNTLKEVDFIAAEDTRVSLKLLNRFDIKKPLVSYHEHNLRERGEYIISRIQSGESCAIITDAGMPCISDPGEDLVRLCHENSISIKVIPGPSAVISALALSGLNASRFTFEGFLSTARTSRASHIKGLENEERAMVFYEAPHKLLSTLTDLKDCFGGTRNITISRELTKIYEESLRFTLEEAVEYYTSKTPKGEFVLVIEGKRFDKSEISFDEAISMAKALLAQGKKTTEAAKIIAKQTAFSKAELYKALLDTENNE